jgi:hypothetical protein
MAMRIIATSIKVGKPKGTLSPARRSSEKIVPKDAFQCETAHPPTKAALLAENGFLYFFFGVFLVALFFQRLANFFRIVLIRYLSSHGDSSSRRRHCWRRRDQTT